jgi:hypothetical protein
MGDDLKRALSQQAVVLFMVRRKPESLIHKRRIKSMAEGWRAWSLKASGRDPTGRLSGKGGRQLPTGKKGTIPNPLFPGKGKVKECGEVKNFPIASTLFKTPTVKTIECQVPPNHLPSNLNSDLGIQT